MPEIYVNTGQYVTLDLYGAEADANPTATLYRGSTPTVLAVTQVSPTPAGLAESWQAYIPVAETLTEAELTVVWAGTAGGESIGRTEYFQVVTPYATPEYIASRFGYSFDELSPNYRSRDEIVNAERVARYLINYLTNQSFGKATGVVTAYGDGTDVLYLGAPVISVDELYQNGELVIDGADFANFGYDVEPTETGLSIRIVDTDFLDLQEFEVPRISPLGYGGGQFRAGWRYTVVGTFGHNYIPGRIAEAAALIINDYLCRDAVWRAKYLNHVEMKDWKFNFEKDAFRGTGNLIADQLIADYAVTKMFVI